jgi:hypothetical protein
MPGGMPLDHDSAEALICDSFLCSDNHALDASGFSVWDLSTFSLTMRGNIMLPAIAKKNNLSSRTSLAEALARLHRVESITIAIPFPFNKDTKGTLQQSAFFRVSDETPGAAEWHKAGYNVFNKQIWDVTLI